MDDPKPRTVYIDINHWYALDRAAKGRPDKTEYAAILTALQAEAEAGQLLLPLSSVTLTELTGNPRNHLRGPAAAVMLKLPRLVMIAPRSRIVDEELAGEFNRRFGQLAFPIKIPRIGYGVCFAFGTPGRVRATGAPAGVAVGWCRSPFRRPRRWCGRRSEGDAACSEYSIA